MVHFYCIAEGFFPEDNVLLAFRALKPDIMHDFVSSEMHSVFERGRIKNGDYLEEQGIDGRIILKFILKKYTRNVGLGSCDS